MTGQLEVCWGSVEPIGPGPGQPTLQSNGYVPTIALRGLTVFGQVPEGEGSKSHRRSLGKMTKSNRFLLTGAAVAGLLAGTSASIQASNLLPGAKASASAQETEKKSDKKVKEKHACKGQNSCKGKGGCKSSDNGCKGKNSCKGKGGCATDGSKMPDEKAPS
jgi:hypothetical protein